jgi:hypothetical protein
VFGRSANDVYADGKDVLLHWDGQAWSAVPIEGVLVSTLAINANCGPHRNRRFMRPRSIAFSRAAMAAGRAVEVPSTRIFGLAGSGHDVYAPHVRMPQRSEIRQSMPIGRVRADGGRDAQSAASRSRGRAGDNR